MDSVAYDLLKISTHDIGDLTDQFMRPRSSSREVQ